MSVENEDGNKLSGPTCGRSNTVPDNTNDPHVSAGRPGQTTAYMENYEHPAGREAESDVQMDLCRMASSCNSPGGPPNTLRGTCAETRKGSSDTSLCYFRSTYRQQVQNNSDNLIILPMLWDLHTRPPDAKPEQERRSKSFRRCTWHHWRLLQDTLTELVLEIEDADPHHWDTHTHPFATPRPPECGITRCQDATENQRKKMEIPVDLLMPTIYLQLQLFSTKDPNEVLEHLVFQCRSTCKQLRAHWRSWSDTERTADPTFRGEGRAFLLMEMTPELRYGNIYYEKMAGS